MTPEEFVKNFYLEYKSQVEINLDGNSKTEVSLLIDDLQLDEKRREKFRQILYGVLKDAFYSILLGLAGEAQIGKIQENFKIEDENCNKLSNGEIESFAWEYFHNNKYELDNSN